MLRLRALRSLSFQSKLWLSYMVLILMPLLCTGYFSYHASVRSLKEHTRQNLESTLEQMKVDIRFKLGSIENISDYLYRDAAFQRMLTASRSSYETYLAGKRLDEYLYPLVNLPTTTNALNLYVDNRYFPESYNVNMSLNPLAKGKSTNIFWLDRIRNEPWYEGFGRWDNSFSWTQVGNDADFGNLSFVRRLYNTNHVPFRFEQAQIGLLRIIVPIHDLVKDIPFDRIGTDSRFYLVGPDERVLYAGPGTNAADFAGLAESSRHLRLETRIPEWDANVVVFVPIAYMQESARQVGLITVWASIVSLVIFAGISVGFSRFFSLRIQTIVRIIQSFRDGEFHKRMKVRRGDEFAQISSAFNDMAETIDSLIKEMYVVNLRKTQAELQALQAQINPHFLYNTLSSISTLAQLGQTDRMHDMVLGLSDYYRLTLNEGEWLIPVEKELQQVQAYLELQRIKYRDRVRVHWEIDERVLPCMTVKIILQPFVENALEHGLYMDNRLNLRIAANRRESAVEFLVADDGVGMAYAKAARLLDPSGASPGYGIRNVDERIKLQFGSEYGVAIVSWRGAGTGVRIRIPIVEQGGERHAV